MIETTQKNGSNGHALAHREQDAVEAVELQGGPAFNPDAMSLKQLWWFCGTTAGTGFLPESIKTPGQALAIVAAGRELGLGVMQSLRGLNIIKGKITLSASTQLALLIRAGIKFRWIEQTDKAAEIEFSRAGMEPAKFRFTIEDAQRAGLQGDNWKKYPGNMLRARAISNGARAYAPDVLDGVYDPAELSADGPPLSPQMVGTVEVHEPESKQRRAASVKERLAKQPEATEAPPPPPSDDAGGAQ
jgi:hypothetical protein